MTLDIYGHIFDSKDNEAAAVFEKAFNGSFGENTSEPGRTK